MKIRLFVVIAFMTIAAGALASSRLDEFKIKREPVFEFGQKPTVIRKGDNITVDFETKGLCDVTIAIEDANGKIVRHLLSGVLGPNAPEPFQKNSKKQSIPWDGKNDQGEYIDDKDTHTIRVSLGLKPRLEKTLYYSPKKRESVKTSAGGVSIVPSIAAAPEGVYVFDGGMDTDQLRLFDHKGNYIRTIYPFPADKVRSIPDLRWIEFPQSGKKLPFKNSFYETTLLTSAYVTNRGFWRFLVGDRDGIISATTMAVRGKRIATAHVSLNKIATDGSTPSTSSGQGGGLSLQGAKVSLLSKGRKGDAAIAPLSSAISPDGKWVYLTGYVYRRHPKGWFMFHGVTRVPYEENHEPEAMMRTIKKEDGGSRIFLGNKDQKGNDNTHFNMPTSVACDSQGRIYVADHGNDRIQVFSPDGKHLKSIPVAAPVKVKIHQRNGDIYVFSWFLNGIKRKKNFPALVTQLGPFDAPRKKASAKLPLIGYSGGPGMRYWGMQFQMELDSWTDPATIWMIPGNIGHSRIEENANAFRVIGSSRGPAVAAIKLCELKKGKLVLKRDFGPEVIKEVTEDRPCQRHRQRLYVNPKEPDKVYVMETAFGAGHVKIVDVATGKVKKKNLPLSVEDMAFDANGYIYLRTANEVLRCDPKTWREIPWDYGESRKSISYVVITKDPRGTKAISALILPPTVKCWHHPGLGVSPNGNIAVACYAGRKPEPRRDQKNKITIEGSAWTPKQFPGRVGGATIHVFDKHGKTLFDDAASSLGIVDGVSIDADNNIYVALGSTRHFEDKYYFDFMAGTLVKMVPGKAKLMSTYKRAAVPLPKASAPKRPPDLARGHGVGAAWVEGAEWFYGGIGFAGNNNNSYGKNCSCRNYRPALDYYARSFAGEIQHCTVAVLDKAGNLILRIGQYGNIDDGKPLVPSPLIPNARSIGGDEVGLMYPAYLATMTDQRLFISDSANVCIRSVKLGYHEEAKVALKDVKDTAR